VIYLDTRLDSFGRVISPLQRPLQGNTRQKDEDKHPCLNRDSNPRSQRPSDQGLNARPLGSAETFSVVLKQAVREIIVEQKCRLFSDSPPFPIYDIVYADIAFIVVFPDLQKHASSFAYFVMKEIKQRKSLLYSIFQPSLHNTYFRVHFCS
jgi:hypothetical protein